MLNEIECILGRWKECFESLFDREEENGPTSSLNGSATEEESNISMDEIVQALRGMKSGKAAGYDKSFRRDAEGRTGRRSESVVSLLQFVLQHLPCT